jgi:hypothetical protein
MRRHIGAKTLARFRQGELSRRRTARTQAHLAGCARCRELNEDLADVTTLLARVQPPPMPEHLAARIQDALAVEVARRATQTAGTTATADPAAPARTAHGLRALRAPRFSSPLVLRVAAATAALVVVAGGGYEIAQHAGGSSTTASVPSSSSASRQAPGITEPAAAAPSFGAALPYQHDGQRDSVIPITTDTDFTSGKLTRQVRDELTKAGQARASLAAPGEKSPQATPSAAAGPASKTFGIPSAALDGCVNRIAAGALVLLVDVAKYQGTPATVIVTGVTAAIPEQVWVVGRGCSASHSDVLSHVMLSGGG